MGRLKRVLAAFIAGVMIFCNFPVYAASYSGAAVKAEYLRTEKRFFSEIQKNFNNSELGKLIAFSDSIDEAYNSELDVEVKIPDIKTRKYVIKGNSTYTDRYEDGQIEVYVEGEQVATFNAVANDNYISLQVPELYEKYLTVDMNDIGGLLKKFDENIDTSTIPGGIFYESDVRKVLALTKSEEKLIENSLKKYGKLFDKELLKNIYFTRENKEYINANNNMYLCSKVSYSISEKQLIDGFEAVWNEFKKDTKLVDLIFSKAKSLYTLYSKVSPELGEFPTKEQILGGVDTIIYSLKEVSSDDSYFKSTLYHQNGKLIRRDFGIVTSYGDESFCTIYTINNSKNAYYALCVEDFKLEDVMLKNSKETTHNFIMTTTTKDYDFVDGRLVVNDVKDVRKMTVNVNRVNDKQYNISFLVDGSDVLVTAEYTNNKSNSKVYDASLNISIEDSNDKIGINTRLAYEKGIKINKISTKNNEVRLNEKTKEELIKLYEENKDEIIEKLSGKFGSAFYIEEIKNSMRNFYDRLGGSADSSTDAQIDKINELESMLNRGL